MDSNPSQTSERMLDPAFIRYIVQRGLYTILGKTSYTLIWRTKHAFTILYTILSDELYTFRLGEQALVLLRIVILMQRKI